LEYFATETRIAVMITDPDAYDRLCESERTAALRAATVEETIAIGEALLTSELMDLAVFPDDDDPMSLTIALGVSPAGRVAGHVAASSK
jgi:hypothetical protein